MDLNVTGQGLRVYSQEYYSKRHRETLVEIIFEPHTAEGSAILDNLFPPGRKQPSGVLRKSFLDKWGRTDESLGSYVRVRPYSVKDLRENDATVSED